MPKITVRFARYLLRYRMSFLILIAGVIVSTYFKLLIPLLINFITQEIITNGDFMIIGLAASGIIVVTIIGGAGDFIFRYSSQFIGSGSSAEIRSDLFQSIQRKSFRFYDQNNTGQIMSRATGDIDAVRRFTSWGMGEAIAGIFLIGSIMYQLSGLDRILLIIISSLAIPLFLNGFIFSKKQRPIWEDIREKFAVITEAFRENLIGVKVIRSFHREKYELEKFDQFNRAFAEANVKMAKTRAIFMPMMVLIVGIGTAATFLYGGELVMNGKIRISDLMEAYSLLILLVLPMRIMGFNVAMALNASAGLHRIFEMIDVEVEIKDAKDSQEIEDIKGEINFENVSFYYEKDRPILKNINLKIKQGETLAIIGETGSGKSTLISMIPRFYDVTGGSVTIDGVDVKKIKLQSLRKMIGLVSQEIFLFSTSIKDNITFGVRNPVINDVIAASKIAEIDEFINLLPNKYDTPVGERGITISGGQKQRIAIARALLTNPKILIFDDSTSSVDVETEFRIQNELKKVLRGKTTLIITQRLSTIRLVDRIAVVKSGELVEIGTHDDLLKKGGEYSKIHQSQFHQQERIPGHSNIGGSL